MRPVRSLPSADAVRKSLAAALLVAAAISCGGRGSTTGPLNRQEARITDEAIAEDLQVMSQWERRVDAVALRSSEPAWRYTVAKARGWLRFAREEYADNDRGPVVEESLNEAIQLLTRLLQQETPPVMGGTIAIGSSRAVRPELWAAVSRFKSHARFDLVAADVAMLEVELVRAGHGAAPGAGCDAARHMAAADSLAALVEEVLRTAPPVVAPPVAPPIAPPADRDRDGVPDSMDCCPNTPPGQTVDVTGCPPLVTERHLIRRGVNFNTSRFSLRPSTRAVLDSVLERLLQTPDVPVGITGHTDAVGGSVFNQRLSESRARAVRDFLVAGGVDAGRLSASGFGEDVPLDDNATVAGRAANRRVELAWETTMRPPDLLPRCVAALPVRVTPPAPPGALVVLDRVFFESASIAILPAAQVVLDRAATAILASGSREVEIAGHADAVGGANSNFALSLARAYKVREYLVSKGVREELLIVKGYESARPLETGRTEAALARNRRVELRWMTQ